MILENEVNDMKKIIIAGVVASVMIFGLVFYKISHPSISKKVETLQEEMTSYHLEATMKMLNGEDLKDFSVQVSYLKEAENDFFCVDLEDMSSHQKQRIIRNGDGVFVVAPSLNRAFQFKSDWPFNSFKPYIMQSVMKVFDEEYDLEKVDKGYQIVANLIYPSDPRVTHLEMTLDEDVNLKNVTLLDDNEVEIVMLDVTTFEWNGSIDPSLFIAQQDPTASVNVSVISDLPMYPLEILGSELVDQTKAEIHGNEKHILRYAGEEHFTIIENTLSRNEAFTIEKMSGDILEIGGNIAILDENVVSLLDGDALCQVFSDDLNEEEKIQVISSMRNSVVNE